LFHGGEEEEGPKQQLKKDMIIGLQVAELDETNKICHECQTLFQGCMDLAQNVKSFNAIFFGKVFPMINSINAVEIRCFMMIFCVNSRFLSELFPSPHRFT